MTGGYHGGYHGYGAGYAAPAVVGGYGVSKVVSPVGAYAAPAVYGGAYAHGMYLFLLCIQLNLENAMEYYQKVKDLLSFYS